MNKPTLIQRLDRDWAINMPDGVRISRHTLKSTSECPLFMEEEIINFVCEKLTAVTEQLKEAREELAGKEDCIDNWMKEAMGFKEQRDGLAEALKDIYTGHILRGAVQEKIEQALQTLNQPTPNRDE